MGRHRRSGKRASRPVRTGLLGASAAVAMGAVAVASGLLPGGDTLTLGGESSPGTLRDEGSATLRTQDRQSTEQSRDAGTGAGKESQRPAHAPSKSPSPKSSDRPDAEPSKKPAAPQEKRTATAAPEQKTATEAPERVEKPLDSDRSAERSPEPPARSSSSAASTPSSSSSSHTAAEAEVLALVNEERAKVGCAPVRFDASLAKLAGDFSSDMAARDFFSHTDPDGATPWDRAEKAGVKNLGGENIARGQADAGAVMNSWMNSEGHRANILNCDYKTLGVGVDMGDGGPWWTQNFGF
ncbi:CAP domain-containing protein [Streptomyces katsurahamanus]|uniref:CAP domain-containing protein n=1 Tax=Streptomyces katsurahamanus TaxID=2577098 RepID=A0ABW9P027_9ACTN|nr:CAP domain-containing protein [Streptomyces katsurahamanus]MQS38927.1 CAP domain-containing protein [Streptomyces katsurahamanus]